MNNEVVLKDENDVKRTNNEQNTVNDKINNKNLCWWVEWTEFRGNSYAVTVRPLCLLIVF